MKAVLSIVLLGTLSLINLSPTTNGAEFISIITEDGWSLQISKENVTFDEALESCKLEEAALLTLNEKKDRKLYDLLMRNESQVQLPGTHYWLGASEVREGVWTWVESQQPLIYSRWASGQPDVADSLNCAFMVTPYELYWRDANCSASFFYICEKEVLIVSTTTEDSNFSSTNNDGSSYAPTSSSTSDIEGSSGPTSSPSGGYTPYASVKALFVWLCVVIINSI